MRVIDADALAREVVEPGQPALAQIVAEFGRDVLQPDGYARPQARSARSCSPIPRERKRLEAITHPAIRGALRDASWPICERAGLRGHRDLGRGRC